MITLEGVRYGRSGWHHAELYAQVVPEDGELELTTPLAIIRLNRDHARQLRGEIDALLGEGPEARLIVETETAGCYQVWHHGQIVVLEAELAKPGPGDFRLYCRELLPGKYELGWERKP